MILTNEAKVQIVLVALAGAVTFIILMLGGSLQPPADMPAPPSQTNYGATN